MTTLYLDIFSGISGDMFIGALIDLGVDSNRLETELQKLKLDGCHLRVTRAQKGGIEGIKFDVLLDSESMPRPHVHEHEHEHTHEHVHADGTRHSHRHTHTHTHGPAHAPDHHEHQHEHGHSHSGADHSHEHEGSRNFSDIQELIQQSALSDWVKDKSVAVFRRVAVAEGKIHGMPPDQVHFHEVGAVDSIVDIVGACIALELLGKPRVLAAPVVEGSGWVTCAHGRFPVPTAATLEILAPRQIALTQCDEPHELVTPTGAALLAEFAERFGLMHNLSPQRIGYGLGTRDNKTRPNVLRVILADNSETAAPHDWETDTITVLETNLDDLSPELLGHFVERALASGALDVFHTPVQMKKNRPGTLLTVLCSSADADRLSEMMLRETSAFGVRRSTAERRKLRREFRQVQTPYGSVTIKIGLLDGQPIQAAPEFESCKKLAEETGAPLKTIFDAARQTR